MNVGVVTAVIVIRGLAGVLFFVFYASSREPRHLVLTLGWLLYALSGGLRLAVPLNPARYWSVVGLTSIGGVGLLMLVAISYLRRSVLRLTVPVLAATMVATGILFVPAQPVNIGFLLYLVQALTLAIPIIAYWRYGTEARRLFPAARIFLTAILSISIVYALLVAVADFPIYLETFGTAVINGVLVSFFVYSEHELVLHDAQRTENRLHRLEESVGIGIWDRMGTDGEAHWSPGHFRIFGLPESSGTAPSWSEYLAMVHPEDREEVETAFENALNDGTADSITYRIVRPNGSIRWISSRAVMLDGDIGYGIIVDVTAIKEAEEQLERNLAEKDTLVAEIHHRVKNNLQVISSMLRLQFDSVTDPQLQALVRRTEERIQAMSTVQDLLLDMPNLAAVEMQDYIRRVADFVERTVALSGLILVNVAAHDIRMEAPTAIALGLIVTELLTNALKHAFPDGATGVVGIELLEDHDAYQLRIRDNGLGMPPAYERSGGLGITLAESFVAQLDGTITIEHRGGTVVTARFYRRHSGTTEGVAAAG